MPILQPKPQIKQATTQNWQNWRCQEYFGSFVICLVAISFQARQLNEKRILTHQTLKASTKTNKIGDFKKILAPL
jgi:hypothetical protein